MQSTGNGGEDSSVLAADGRENNLLNHQTSRRVLHIDDDASLTTLTKAKLRSHGFQVDSLNDPRRAEEVLLAGNYRVVILDIEMPYISGIELLRQIKEHDGSIQVIMLTSFVRMFAVLETFRAGAQYCFFKPISDWEPLIQGLETTFERIDHWRKSAQHVSQSQFAAFQVT